VQKEFFYRRLVRPILDLLRQGVTPEKMALSLALGGALGVFPALGCTTLLCTIVAPLPVSIAQIQGMIHANAWAAARFLWTTTWHAIVAWGLIAPVFVGLAYLILTPVLQRVLHREVTPTAETD